MKFRVVRAVWTIKTLFLEREIRSLFCDSVLLFGAAFLLYSVFVSCSFNEGDSFNFARRLTTVDIATERPHAPGYLIYRFLGRILFSVTHDKLAALTWISIINDSLTLIPLYHLTRARAYLVRTCRLS